MTEHEWFAQNSQRLALMPLDALVHAVWQAAAPTTGSAPVALGELAGWCFPSGGRTRFADQGDTVDLSLKDVMRPVYFAAPASPAASAPDDMTREQLLEALQQQDNIIQGYVAASPAASVLSDDQRALAENVAMHCSEAHILAGNKVCSGLMQEAAKHIRALLAASIGEEPK